MCIPAITVLSSYAANPQMEYLISFLSLFSAPVFVLPFETCALIKQRSGLFSPLLKNIKVKHTWPKGWKLDNQNTLSLLSSVWFCVLIPFADKGEISYSTVEVNKAISLLKSMCRGHYVLVFYWKERFILQIMSFIDWFIYLIHSPIALIEASALALCCCCLTEL